MRSVRSAFFLLACALSPVALAAPCAGFTDVDDSSAFCVNVAWIKNRGITLGCTATLYCPDSPVTRLQMAAFLYRLGFQNAFLQGGNSFGTTAVLGTADNQALEFAVSGLRLMRFEVAQNLIGGSPANSASTFGNVIAGGGSSASCSAPFRTGRSCANVAGGPGDHTTIGGGASNIASGDTATVSGGRSNTASGTSSTVSGGISNAASGVDGIVAGGIGNNATGRRSFAAGTRANAAQQGCFVWSDAVNDNATSCFAPNEFVARAMGGFYFWTSGSDDNSYAGARLASGTGAWAAYSDRNGKDRIDPVDPRDVLDKLVAMPIATWEWKAESGSVRHMGPMAQDFHAAFGLGDSDRQIVTVDADGVALAAIQGLNAKHEAERITKDAQIAALRAELAELRTLLERARVGDAVARAR